MTIRQIRLNLFRKFLVIYLIFVGKTCLKAQDETSKTWSFDCRYLFQINQASFVNRAEGGQNFIGFDNSIDFTATYQKNYWNLTYNYKQHYGITRFQEDSKFRKTQDVLEFHLKLNRSCINRASSGLTLFVDLFTQAAPGFAFLSTERSSSFFAPAFLTEGLAYEYRATDINLSISLSALTGKQTVVLDPRVDGYQFGLSAHNGVLNEMGGYLQAAYEGEILPRTHFSTNIFLFTNYLENFGNIDIRWDANLRVSANKWFSVNITTNFLYNPNLDLPTFQDLDNDGSKEEIGRGPKVQFMQSVGVGACFRLGSKNDTQ